MTSFEALKRLLKRILQVEGIKVDADTSGLAKETTLQGIKSQTDKLTYDTNNNLQVAVASESVGLAKDATVQAIKAQTDKLTFDASGNLLVAQGARSAGTITVASSADISSGVTANLPPLSKWTLYLHADDAVDVDIYLSPDGTNWFKIPESPVSFTGAGDNAVEFGYVAKAIKLVGSNSTTVTAIIYYVV